MLISKKKWELPKTYYKDGCMAEYIMRNRGYTNPIEDFIQCSHEQLLSPFVMKGMKKAVSRILSAIENQEKILVYGDYDADGVTGTTLLVKALKILDGQVDYYIPNRFVEGYGLNMDAICQAKRDGISLIITVDTGITAMKEVEFAKSEGIDVIITDHHEPLEDVPSAYAILNPKYSPCEYPEQNLAGVGVAFKLSTAILGRVPLELLDLVALGTVADLVPLLGENRILVALGLHQIASSPSIGIKALLEVTGLSGKPITPGHLGFQLGPRINASGRLETAENAIELLLSENIEHALDLANVLHDINEKRQMLVEETYRQVEQKLLADRYLDENDVIVLADEGWNHGVIGIVASRVLDKYYRPVVLIAIDGGIGKGSARSIKGFHMFQCMQQCAHVFEKYGGHAMAAGFSIKVEQIPSLQEALNLIAKKTLSAEDYVPLSSVDIVLTIPETMAHQSQISKIEQLGPFGMGHSQPSVLITGATLKSNSIIGKDKNHMKFTFTTSNQQLDVLGFQWVDRVGGILQKSIASDLRFELLGELSINTWRDTSKPQLVLKDCSVSPIQFAKSSQHGSEIVAFLKEHGIEAECFPGSQLAKEEMIQLFEGIYQQQLFINPLRNRKVTIIALDFEIETVRRALYRIPERNDFGTAYRLLTQAMSISREQWLKACISKGFDHDYCLTILDIFLELGFVTVEEDQIIVSKNPKKQSLEDSSVYFKINQRAIMVNKHVLI